MKFDFTTHLQKIEAILEQGLPEEYSNNWMSNTFSNLLHPVPTSLIDALSKPCRSLLLLGGKRWRPLFMVLCAELALESNNEIDDAAKEKILDRVYKLTPLVEFVHTASLIHDDIEDSADIRRGKPSAHITHGIDIAINAGSWLFFHASSCISSTDIYWGCEKDSLKVMLYENLMLELRRLHLGQAMDISWHKNDEMLPSMEEYLTMTSLKTGTLASLSAKLGLLAAGETSDITTKIAKSAADIGIAFQILDDIKNLTTGNVGKKRGDDIVEGKKSLPILLHLESRPDDFNALMECFSVAKKEGIESMAVEKAITIIETSNAIERAKTMAEKLITDSCKTMRSLYPNAKTIDKIDYLFESLF